MCPQTSGMLSAALQADLDDARWTQPEQFHLTLRFLGDTEPERLPALEAALAAASSSAPDLRLDGLTVFPSRRRPRVLVARVTPDGTFSCSFSSRSRQRSRRWVSKRSPSRSARTSPSPASSAPIPAPSIPTYARTKPAALLRLTGSTFTRARSMHRARCTNGSRLSRSRRRRDFLPTSHAPLLPFLHSSFLPLRHPATAASSAFRCAFSVRSNSASPWREEKKNASNWDGAR